MECEQALCKWNYEACFTFACNMCKGMNLDRFFGEKLGIEWWFGNIWCWQKCDYSWYGPLKTTLSSVNLKGLLLQSLSGVVSPFTNCVVTSLWDGAFRIILGHTWIVLHASVTTGKHPVRWSAATTVVGSVCLLEKCIHLQLKGLHWTHCFAFIFTKPNATWLYGMELFKNSVYFQHLTCITDLKATFSQLLSKALEVLTMHEKNWLVVTTFFVCTSVFLMCNGLNCDLPSL